MRQADAAGIPRHAATKTIRLVTGSEYKTVRLWDLSSKILRLKRGPENTGGLQAGFPCRHAVLTLLQSLTPGQRGWHDSKGGMCEAERLTRPEKA